MRSKLAFLVLVSGLAQAQTVSSVAGKWKVHTVVVQESDSTCTFTQKDADFTGACEGDNGKFNITGKVDGDKISWSFKTEYNGDPLTIGFNAQYIIDFLKAAGSGDVKLELKDAQSAGQLRPAAGEEYKYRYIVMPMRI